MGTRRVSVVIGTRPELIKLAPIVWEASRRNWEVQTIISGQHHPNMLDPLLEFFKIEPSVRFPRIDTKGDLNRLSANLLELLSSIDPGDLVICQGDTTTAMTAALWGFHRKAKIAHVEAGLRTHDLRSPFPEEANRQLIGRIADYHFAPTKAAAENLTAEGIDASKIYTVGNTGIDSLLNTVEKIDSNLYQSRDLDKILNFVNERPLVLVTTHRRENQGESFKGILHALSTLALENPHVAFVLPVHPNPAVAVPIRRELSSLANVLLVDPLAYPDFIGVMNVASVLLSDSGGIQEEGPSLNKPIIVMRENTERPEAVERDYARLVGTDSAIIIEATTNALMEGCQGFGGNPFGDGFASQRIFDNLDGYGRVEFHVDEAESISIIHNEERAASHF